MPKKTKTTPNADSVIESEKTPRARSTTTTKKSPAKAKRTAKPKPEKSPAPSRTDPTDEEIQLRAYFISERRHRLDLVGDTSSDWIEARRQLLSELAAR